MNDLHTLAVPGDGTLGPFRASTARTRLVRGTAMLAAGATSAFLLMARDARASWSIPAGAIAIGVATWGALDVARAEDDRPSLPSSGVSLRTLAPSLVIAFTAFALFLASVSFAARGLVPSWLASLSITLTYVGTVASVFRVGERLGPWALDESGAARPLHARHGFWLVLLAGLLYLPTLGLSSLWDPWETHYGEVAREILVRDDWISLWWGKDGFFYSKPVLVFWMQALVMAALGMDVRPDHVLVGPHGEGTHPEWIVRLPNALLAVLGLYFLYRGVAKVFGRRAALLSAVVLATSPHWFLLAHQSITDMPFVASMSAAIGLLLCGLHTDDTAVAREHVVRIGARSLRLSAWHMCFGAILMCALPQAIYLLSRNVDLVLHATGAHGFRPHMDEFRAGSGGGNCVLPGNPACGSRSPVHAIEPFVQGIVWLAGAAFLLVMNRGETRIRRLYFIGAWLCAALATLAKGPAGFGLPVLCVLAYVVATKRWTLLFDLEIASGALIVAVVALPWYIAAFVRHGTAFTDELIFNDMINRAFSHVHDTNEGDDTSFRYYVYELGFGLFPWTGLAPLGLTFWLRRGQITNEDRAKADASILLVMWFLFAFALFSMMGTKFHHYIFPAVPPLAILIGLALDDILGDDILGRGAFTLFRRANDAEATTSQLHTARMVGAAALSGALVLALVARDLVHRAPGEQDGAIRFAQLFSYQYKRPWPTLLDFELPLLLFGGVAVALLVLMSARAIRRHAIAGFTALAVLFAVWGGDVYLTKTAAHWGQGDVIRAYYAQRASDAEPIVAYQLNWKGENFYTGNRVSQFVSSGAPFTKWLHDQKEHGTNVVFFVLERSRVASLKGEAHAQAWTEVTGRESSHQFVLMRAEL